MDIVDSLRMATLARDAGEDYPGTRIPTQPTRLPPMKQKTNQNKFIPSYLFGPARQPLKLG